MAWFSFIQYRISMVFLVAFLLVFVPRRYSLGRTLLILAGLFAVTAAGDWYMSFHETGVSDVLLNTLLQILAVQGITQLISRARGFRTLFLGFTGAVYLILGNSVSGMVHRYTGDIVMGLGAQVAVHAVLLTVLIRLIGEDYLAVLQLENLPWREFCVIPGLFYATSYTLLIWPGSLYKTPDNCVAAILLMLLMVASYVMILQTFARMQRQNAQQHDMELLETYAAGLRESAEALHTQEEATAVLRHDSRHRAMLVRTYLDNNELEKIRALMDSLDTAMIAARPHHYCENVAVDSILSQRLHRADSLGVRAELEVSVPANLGDISEFELATVVSNLVENAVSAAAELPEGQRWIRVRCYPVKAQLLLEVTNPYLGRREISQETGLPVSRRGVGHGYGLRSVQSLAEKRGAVFSYSAENNVFCVRLLENFGGGGPYRASKKDTIK